MRTNISAVVQLGPQTLWGSAACDCNGTDDDCAVFDPPLQYPRCAGAEEANVRLSKNTDPKP